MAFVDPHKSNETLNQLRLRFNEVVEKIGELDDFDQTDEPTLTETIIEWTERKYVNTSGDTIDGNLTIEGDLTVKGDSFVTETEEVKVEDNTITVNHGETGSGVTHNDGFAGIEVDRGDSADYYFVFEEERERFVIGKSDNLQVVATREDDPEDGAFAVWSNDNKRFETSKKTMDRGGTIVEEANATDIAIQMAIALG